MEIMKSGHGVASTTSSISTDSGPQPAAVVKGKRTKRQRSLCSLSSSPAATAAESSSSEISGKVAVAADATDQEEEEEMANCLMLLARGGAAKESDDQKKKLVTTTTTSRRRVDDGAGDVGGAYECKTCNKSFPSFQALGGHRASHKKPKTAVAAVAVEMKRSPVAGGLDVAGDHRALQTIAAPPPIMSSSKLRVHECSICGAEFSSGQALGGHMRRHRPASSAPPPETTTMMMQPAAAKRTTNSTTQMPILDLNLPAPAEDHEFIQSSPPTFTALPLPLLMMMSLWRILIFF